MYIYAYVYIHICKYLYKHIYICMYGCIIYSDTFTSYTYKQPRNTYTPSLCTLQTQQHELVYACTTHYCISTPMHYTPTCANSSPSTSAAAARSALTCTAIKGSRLTRYHACGTTMRYIILYFIIHRYIVTDIYDMDSKSRQEYFVFVFDV